MCECHQIGGPFIAEDPNCPIHGIEAQRRESMIDELLEFMQEETNVERLREMAAKIASLARQ